jgi:cysteine desulfurase/selenocysteine lyase
MKMARENFSMAGAAGVERVRAGEGHFSAKGNLEGGATDGFDVLKIRAQFPLLGTTSHGKPLVYLDNGATTQKPRAVIDAETEYYQRHNANIHRGVYQLSQDATEAYERARANVARFINAAEPAECIFTRGTTEAINLVAACWGRKFLSEGDEIIVSALEHHSNIVPWQMICESTGAHLRVIPMNDAGELRLDEYAKLLNERTRIVAVTQVSNALGTINDVATIARLAHEAGVKVLIDGAQWIAHYPTDVRKIGADFYAFSGHKLYGPTGIGVLYGRRELLEAMPPYQGGGDMIESVTFAKTTYAAIPNKFEAGTPNIAGAIGLGAAIDFVRSIGFDAMVAHEHALLEYATQKLSRIAGLRIIGTARAKSGVISMVLDDPPMSALDLGMALDARGLAVRTGHHCCQPVMERLKIPATTRASLGIYNTRQDIDALVEALTEIVKRGAANEAARRSAASAAPVREQPADAEVIYPKAYAESPQAAADELAEQFEFLGDHTARYDYVMDLGQKLPDTFDLLKKVTPRVPGCMSEVYIVARPDPLAADKLQFIADADSSGKIVRGLIVILERLYSGHRGQDILDFDIEVFFRRIGLEQMISTQRRTGLAGMVSRIRALAKELTQPAAGKK